MGMAKKIIKELFSSYSECREQFWIILCHKLKSSYTCSLIVDDKEKNITKEDVDEDYKNDYWNNYILFEENKGSNSNFLSLQQKQDKKDNVAVPKYISTDSITIFLNVWSVLYYRTVLSTNQHTFIIQLFLSFLKNAYCYKKSNNNNEVYYDPDKLEIMALLSKMDVKDDTTMLKQVQQYRETKQKPT